MKLERIGAGTCDTGPKEKLRLDSAAHSRKPHFPQARTIPPMPAPESGISIAEWRAGLVHARLFEAVQVVDGDALGPIAVLGSPRVCVGFAATYTAVWIERKPWGWSDPYKLFLRPRSAAACRYAVELARKIRAAAEVEEARIERLREAKRREAGR